MRARAIVALAVCAGGLGAACAGGGAGEDGGTGDGRSQDAVIVDEARGTFRGLRLGESAAQVRQRMGPTRCDEEARIAPLGEDYDDIGIPYWGNYQPRDKDARIRNARCATGAWSCQCSCPTVRSPHHRGVSDAHLPVYLDEYVFRRNRRGTPMAAFQTLLGLSALHQQTAYRNITLHDRAA